jgi:hypothetical protein
VRPHSAVHRAVHAADRDAEARATVRGLLAGHADLRGEHPMIVGVPDRDALSRVYDRLTAQGFRPQRGEHADAAWIEVADPDGICIRIAVTTAKPEFFGVTPDGFYGQPRLVVP